MIIGLINGDEIAERIVELGHAVLSPRVPKDEQKAAAHIDATRGLELVIAVCPREDSADTRVAWIRLGACLALGVHVWIVRPNGAELAYCGLGGSERFETTEEALGALKKRSG